LAPRDVEIQGKYLNCALSAIATMASATIGEAAEPCEMPRQAVEMAPGVMGIGRFDAHGSFEMRKPMTQEPLQQSPSDPGAVANHVEEITGKSVKVLDVTPLMAPERDLCLVADEAERVRGPDVCKRAASC
jgi:hypothetical protein